MTRAAERPASRMTMRTVACPLCGGCSFETLAKDDRYRMSLQTVGCHTCGFVFTNPQPTPEALARFYAHDYRRLYQSVDKPTDAYIEELGKDERAAAVCTHLLSRTANHDVRFIADVGCAEGSLLRVLRSRVAAASLFGVEVDRSFAEFARQSTGATVVESMDALPKRRFDLVILNHVLEHVADAVGYLRDVGSLLVPEGRLYVAVPDAASYTSLKDLHIAHLAHYTAVSLERLLLLCGYEVLHKDTTNPPRHPKSIAFVARFSGSMNVRPAFDHDATGWSNVRQASRWAAVYHLRRAAAVRWILKSARSVLRT